MKNLTNIAEIKALLKKHGFQFTKSLGQNFIVNPSICPRMAHKGNAQKGYCILEVGTGIGVLTAELAKRADKVVAVEIDQALLPILKETLEEFDNVKILNEDILKINLHQLFQEEFAGKRAAVCANLPYYITSPVLMRLLEERLPIETITVMVQKEAAQRLCAKTGTRESGAITYAANYYADIQKLFDVSRGSFIPSPKVDSAVIQLTIKKKPDAPVKDEALLFALIHAGFSQRRKTMINPISQKLEIDKQRLKDVLAELGIDPMVRAEQMTLEQFSLLADALS